MKNIKIIAILMAAIIGILTFSQCKKDHGCTMRVKCYRSTNGLDADTVAPYSYITLDISKYTNGNVDTLLKKIDNVQTDKNGVYEYTHHHPALFIVNAVNYDTIKDETGNVTAINIYKGTTQVQVGEDEIAEKVILMIPSF